MRWQKASHHYQESSLVLATDRRIDKTDSVKHTTGSLHTQLIEVLRVTVVQPIFYSFPCKSELSNNPDLLLLVFTGKEWLFTKMWLAEKKKYIILIQGRKGSVRPNSVHEHILRNISMYSTNNKKTALFQCQMQYAALFWFLCGLQSYKLWKQSFGNQITLSEGTEKLLFNSTYLHERITICWFPDSTICITDTHYVIEGTQEYI